LQIYNTAETQISGKLACTVNAWGPIWSWHPFQRAALLKCLDYITEHAGSKTRCRYNRNCILSSF